MDAIFPVHELHTGRRYEWSTREMNDVNTPFHIGDLISIRDWNVRQSRWNVGHSDVLWKFPVRSRDGWCSSIHVPDLFFNRPDYRALSAGWREDARRLRLISRGHRLSTTTCNCSSYSACTKGAFPRNFNPRPRRVARIIRGYIDQSMLAPTESRTLLSRVASDLRAGRRYYKYRAINVTSSFYSLYVLNKISLLTWRKDWIISRISWIRAPWKPPPVGHITTCPPPTIVNPLEYAIVDTRVDFQVSKENRQWRSILDFYIFRIEAWHRITTDWEQKPTLAMTSDDDYWWWK